jgi:hypothetical protein
LEIKKNRKVEEKINLESSIFLATCCNLESSDLKRKEKKRNIFLKIWPLVTKKTQKKNTKKIKLAN